MQSFDNHLTLQHAKTTEERPNKEKSPNKKKTSKCFNCCAKGSISIHSQSGFFQKPGQNCPICNAEFSNFTLLNHHVASKHRPSELRKKLREGK